MIRKLITIISSFIVVIYFIQISVASTSAAYTFPLKKSSNNRYFVDQNNQPFFINGDTPWSLIGQVSKTDADYYLNDAKNKGINNITVTLVEGYYADQAPANKDGTIPFNTPNKFSTPNSAYFDHADSVISKAASLGIHVMIAPLYLGCCSDGWWDALSNNTTTDMQTYGTFIGNRYKNIPNIMYVWINDRNPCGPDGSTSTSCTQRGKIKAMIEAVKAADPNHLHTYHFSPETSPLELANNGIWYPWDPAKDVNITYTYNAVQDRVLADYNRRYNGNPEPFFLFESKYENEHGSPPLQQRKQAYNAVLSGSSGHQYGNNPIWYMGSTKGWAPWSSDWKGALNDEARADLIYVKNLFESRSWFTLIPDQNHTVLTNGYSSGDSFAGAAQTQDKSTLIIYTPTSRSLTVNLTNMSGTQSKAFWFNPTNGSATLIGTYNNTLTSQSFTSNGESVLVIDDASKNYPAPGGGSIIPTITSSPTSTPIPTNTPTKAPTATPTRSYTPTPSLNRPCQLIGDTANPTCNNRVDVLDFSFLSSKFNTNTKEADLDSNGSVNVLDYTVLANNFGKSI